jgi:hypothetical protein
MIEMELHIDRYFGLSRIIMSVLEISTNFICNEECIHYNRSWLMRVCKDDLNEIHLIMADDTQEKTVIG